MDKITSFIKSSFAGCIIIVAGIILAVLGFLFFRQNIDQRDYKETQAVVSKLELFEDAHYETGLRGSTYVEATYTVFVKYTVDGKEYEAEYGIYSDHKVGDEVKILYDPKNPQEIGKPAFKIYPYIFLGGGCILVIVGGVLTFRGVKKGKIKEEKPEYDFDRF